MNHPLKAFEFCPRCGSKQFNINDERSRHCTNCNLTYYANASASTAAIITNSKGEVLLTTRAFNPAKGMLDLPGGFVDMNETAEEAIIRELKEELNINIQNPKYLFSLPNEYEFSGITVHTLDIFFKIEIDDNTIIKTDDDVASAQFYDLNNVNIENIGLQSIKTAIEKFRTK
ncbi:MAG: NUDIX domain-containing protein [Paludibacteraceae bacterium]|jgi:mutator protein MutT|nr:NUDIX domain-containing protein [Paludibacteraceae bacterium]